MTQHLKAQLRIKEEREVQEEMNKIQQEYQPDWRSIKHKYMRGMDISNMGNYRAMITRITAKACSNQRQIRTGHACKRQRCRGTTAETYAGYVQPSLGGHRQTISQPRMSSEKNHEDLSIIPALHLGHELKHNSVGVPAIDGGDSIEAQEQARDGAGSTVLAKAVVLQPSSPPGEQLATEPDEYRA